MEIYFKYLIYFFCFFPFLLPLKVLGTDIQFYAFIVSIAYLSCLSKWYYSKEIKLFCLYFFIAAIIGILSAPNIIIMVRCLFQYASLFFICCAVYNLLIRENGLDIRLSKYFILCWFIVGAIQTFLFPDFGGFLVANSRTTSDRGVYSLASEPSFFGLQCFYFLFIASTFDKHKKIYFALISIMVLIFAQSFTGLVFLIFMLAFFISDSITFRNISIKWILSSIIIIGLSVFYIGNHLRSSRLGSIITLLISNENLAKKDESSSVRFNAIFESLQTSYNNVFFPNGFTERVGSMFGGILQELGIIGLPLMVIVTLLLISYYRKKWVKYVAFIIIFILFFTNMQMANPTFAFVLALSIYQNENQKQSAVATI